MVHQAAYLKLTASMVHTRVDFQSEPLTDFPSNEAPLQLCEWCFLYLVPERKLHKIKNVCFCDISIFLNSLMLRHHRISKK